MQIRTILAVILVIGAIAGCKSVPIQNVSNVAITSSSGKPLSPSEVRTAIVQSGVSLGWKITDDGPEKLVGTLVLRTHTAVVDIPYSGSSYSVNYKSSVNLNEGEGQIHKNYNSWIQNLTRAIDVRLAGL